MSRSREGVLTSHPYYGAKSSIPARPKKNISSRRHAGIGKPVPLIRQAQPNRPRPSWGDVEAKLSAVQRQSEEGMRILLIIVAACALGGCVHTQARDDAACRSYGAKRGTELYTVCRMQIEAHRQNNLAVAAAAFGSLAETERQRVQAMRPPRSTNCTANTFGYNTTMHCW
jgi:hypothetical protein